MALFSALAVYLTLRGGGVSLDTDSAMRLAGVRDLLAGQGWFDTAQHRMNTPYGLLKHWSRLGDICPVVLALLMPEKAMLYVWPLLTFLPVLWALARLAETLAGRGAVLLTLGLALLCEETYGLFTPGNLDHHNLQLGLVLWTLVFLLEQRAAAAAVTIALSLCIGLETLPYAIIAILAASLLLKDDAPRARRFGLVLASAAALLLLAIVAQPYRFAFACDTFSLFYAGLLAAGGLGPGLIANLRPGARLLGFAGIAIVLALLAASENPACLAGPYAGVSPHLNEIFLARINEAHPAWDFIHFAPSEFVAGWCYGAFGLAAAQLLPASRARNFLLAFGVVAMAAATLQIREANALPLALPAIGALVAQRVASRSIGGAALAVLIFSDAAFALAGSYIEGDAKQAARIHAFNAQVACGEDESLAPLKALPPGRVAGFVDQGPGVLAFTRHAVIAGPYHRDGDVIEDTFAIFTGTPDAARAVLQKRGINYLMTCKAAPDWNYYIAKAPDGLLAQLSQNRIPTWLTPAGGKNDVKVWRIAP